MNATKNDNSSRMIGAVMVTALALAAVNYYYGSSSANRDIVPVPQAQPAIEQPAVNAPKEIGGRVIYFEGQVRLSRDGGEWAPVTEGADMVRGDALQTLADGRAIIALDDGSFIRLDSDSSAMLVSMDPSHVVVANVGGSLYVRVKRAERLFEVTAGELTYESLGTAYLTTNKLGERGVKVYHSKVRVKKGATELAVVEQGQKYFVELNDDTQSENKAADLTKEERLDDKFVKWNRGEDEVWFKDELGALVEDGAGGPDDAAGVSSIVLKQASGATVSWAATGTAAKGFKIVWSKNAAPTYPTRNGDKFAYYDDPAAKQGTLTAFDGSGTYHVRVCEYLGDKCGVYSNEITVELQSEISSAETDGDKPAISVTSIALAVTADGKASWTVQGESPKGYKLVWSKGSGPTYPTRGGDRFKYYDDSAARSGEISAFDGSGTYYARVCEYLDGVCGKYSNEVTVELGGGEALGVSSVTLAHVFGSQVSWNASGISELGFKLVWSKNAAPTYPTRQGDNFLYYGDPNDSTGEITAFDGTGTYHVRVCEYLGDKCGTYSNEVEVGL